MVEAISLMDLKRRSETIELSIGPFIVYGLTADDMMGLLTRFPSLQGLSIGRGIGVAAIQQFGPTVMGAIIAAGAGHSGNEDAEAGARNLPISEQVEILEAIGRCTFTKGFGPFRRKIQAFLEAVFAGDSRVQPTSSPKPSQPSTDTVTPPSGE